MLFNETEAGTAPKNDKILLLDADTVAYSTVCVCEIGDDEAGYQIDIDYALEVASSKVDKILNTTGCKDVELHFTGGRNFRYEVSSDYKSNRKGKRRPEGLEELKALMAKTYSNSTINIEFEADDSCVMLKTQYPDKYILSSPDKDVLYNTVGKHFNYYENSKYKIPMKWVEVTQEEAIKFFYKQVLTGDSTDGIKGVPRCGPKTADKILKDCKTELEMWNETLKAYKCKGLTNKDAIKTARLVGMHQMTKEGKLDLWIPPMEKDK